MDSSSSIHHQETLESILVSAKPLSQAQQDKKPRPADQQALKCPRCDSINTKFCYYNNYSLSQPRYFCKSCRRYWTKGGTLRNVPVGGGCRKNKRSTSSSSKRSQDQGMGAIPSPIPCLGPIQYDSNDLTLAIARLQKQGSGQMGFEEHDFGIWGNPNHMSLNDVIGASSFDPMRNGMLESHHHHHQNLYYGGGDVAMENVGIHDMGIQFEGYNVNPTGAPSSLASVKQELCGVKEAGENRILWGFPWQTLSGDGELSTWHGLVNSPLM